MVADPVPSRGAPMTSIAELYAFQEVDLELKSARDELEDVRSQLGETEALVAARTTVGEKREAVAAAEHVFKEREAEADDLRTKIEPVEEKLYKGTVQNPKELEDLQQDLESLRRRRSELEDHALEAMDALEAAQQALADADAEFAKVEQEFGSDQATLVNRQAELVEQIAKLEALRADEVEGIDETMLELYNRLAPGKQGRAVAKVDGGACGRCRISLPTNVLQRARGGSEIVRCSSCDRILFVS